MSDYRELVSRTETPYFVELYTITIQGTHIQLTNHKDVITHPAFGQFLPAVIERRDISYSASGEISTELLIYAGMEAINTIVNAELPFIQVRIMLYFPNEQVTHTIFTGICKEIAIASNYYVALRLVDYLSMSKVNIPKFTYSAYCNNTFGDEHCRVLLSQFTVMATVMEVENRTALVSNTFTNYPEDYFSLGVAEFIHENRRMVRLITKHIQSQGKIYLQMPFEVSVDNKQIRVTAGCNKTPYACKYKFNNIHNFTGFPYIPVKNPSLWGV